jgi:DNA-binding NtrC family response regulator
MNKTVLLVTQDTSTNTVLLDILSSRGYRVLVADAATTAIEQIQRYPIDVVITELGPQEMSSLDGLDKAMKELLRMSAVVIAAEDTPVRVLTEVIRQGAAQLLITPFQEQELLGCLARTLSEQPLRQAAPPPLRQGPMLSNIITQNPPFQAVLAMATKAARTDATMLITGETGTGKELLAGEIHRISLRAQQPFVTVNCATLSETLLETELFGHVRGAFTGADQAKSGFFEIADGGTIFLDEIGEISHTFQLKLLRILQQGEYNRVGDTRTYRTNVRVLAATNQDLMQAVREQRFRADLFYRLHVIPLYLPPLRQRKDDIPALARFFLHHSSQELGQPITRIAPNTLQLLEQYDWPGNIRELHNVIERAVIMGEGDTLKPEHLPEYLLQASANPSANGHAEQHFDASFKIAKEAFVGAFERRYILHHLSLHRGNVAKTARTIGMFEGHLYQKIKRYQIDPNQFRLMD